MRERGRDGAGTRPEDGDPIMLAALMGWASEMVSGLRRDLRGVTPLEYGIVLGLASLVVGTTAFGALDTDILAAVRRALGLLGRLF
jgi:Flp pilus assembly pilin Flp